MWWCVRILSTTRHASSTPSWRANSRPSPLIASPSSRSYGLISSGNSFDRNSSRCSPMFASPGILARAPRPISIIGLNRKRM